MEIQSILFGASLGYFLGVVTSPIVGAMLQEIDKLTKVASSK